MPHKKQVSGALPAGRSEQATQEPMCARCGSSATWEDCDNCEGGFSYHDCGEDTCCCLYPEDNRCPAGRRFSAEKSMSDKPRNPWPLRLAQLGALIGFAAVFVSILLPRIEWVRLVGYGGIGLWLAMFAIDG